MFDFVRSHRSWMMLFILVLILPSFVFFGIQGYNNYVGQDGALATVDGAPITQQEYDDFIALIAGVLADNGVSDTDINECFAPPLVDPTFAADFIGH